MPNEVMSVTDPLGNKIYVLDGSCLSPEGKNSPEVYDDLVAVIEKPAILIRTENGREELNYFRSIGWHHTILLKVQKTAGRWETFSCVHNPSTETLSELLRAGRQLI